VGVLIVARPGLNEFKLGYLFAGTSVVFYSIFLLMTRKLSATESQVSLMLIPASVAVVAMLPFLGRIAGVPGSLTVWAVLLAICVTGTMGQVLLVKAYTLAPASSIAPYGYIQIVLSIALGYAIFDFLPDFWTVVGCCIVTFGGIYLWLQDRQSGQGVPGGG
ncbi:MAG: DMT family transporter, partial [Alphaproteobacteria bacterium]|nr:DMT family transporter [Alphaproteobacteria bacterium]